VSVTVTFMAIGPVPCTGVRGDVGSKTTY
jgi:hypothetical protein